MSNNEIRNFLLRQLKNQELRLLKTLDLLEPLVRIERTTY